MKSIEVGPFERWAEYFRSLDLAKPESSIALDLPLSESFIHDLYRSGVVTWWSMEGSEIGGKWYWRFRFKSDKPFDVIDRIRSEVVQ